ncbi:hypothetical protein BO94DRAFT_453324 [Aspergillus sclerotioniger CBS 115572]|uniref:Uncharacterized protein n=1 Tax=Aspergillus sclerotioniger CBS 115572 TaxID=1450535 RepID=A0A317XE05_9EURO|nr:hypothetical protein BO94DRAFT_453324 [Aspergillus sclerotioniger CBS 115572]PWY96733.1 hypothetical protein BO94DRAFT_453324 [Aspergillus sclerotioniger CBS 115572]
MSGLSPSDVEYEKAHIHQSRQAACYAVTITFFILAICCISLRVISRRMQRLSLALDDYLAIAGAILLIPFMAASLGVGGGQPLRLYYLYHCHQTVHPGSSIPHFRQHRPRIPHLHLDPVPLDDPMGRCVIVCLLPPMSAFLEHVESHKFLSVESPAGVLC